MSDRKLIDLNDNWAITADSLQWMISRKSGDSLQARRFVTKKSSILQAVDAPEKTDTIFVGPITEEARRFIESLPESHSEWVKENPDRLRGRGRPREGTASDDGDDSPPSNPDIYVGKARSEGDIVLIPYAQRQEDGKLVQKVAKVKPPPLEGNILSIIAKTRRAWMRKREHDGFVVAGVRNLESLSS